MSPEPLAGASGGYSAGRFYGKYRGRVSDTQDPLKLGRIKATVPEVLGDEATGWAVPCVPYAGDKMGFSAVPEVDTGVWIEFEAGDPSRPIWSGCWWSDGQLPQNEQGAEASPPLKIWRTREGLLLAFDDDARTITLSDQNGSNLLTIDAQGGEIKLLATAKVVVEAPQIELVEGAAHPLVFGDDLLSYLTQIVQIFNMHLHPGQMAGPLPVSPVPPVGPMTPPSPSLLSLKVKTG
ncbi:MAG: hypothetical protein IT159_02300 [Bryobacterales bacterium]|nr:hypothetical protein [Bryobacterales bacterium]